MAMALSIEEAQRLVDAAEGQPMTYPLSEFGRDENPVLRVDLDRVPGADGLTEAERLLAAVAESYCSSEHVDYEALRKQAVRDRHPNSAAL